MTYLIVCMQPNQLQKQPNGLKGTSVAFLLIMCLTTVGFDQKKKYKKCTKKAFSQWFVSMESFTEFLEGI